MQLTVLGSSPSFAAANGASSGYIVSRGATRLLVDCGHGVVGILQSVIDIPQLTGIIISHMHPDHIFDLVPLRYAYFFQRIPPVPLWLPPDGMQALLRLQAAVDLPENFFTGTFEVGIYRPEADLDVGELRLTFAPTRHYVAGYAMRFHPITGPDRDLMYSSDTGWTEPVRDLARDAEVALVEATVPEYYSDEDRYGHLTPDLAGRLAREAGVQRLIVTHYYSPAREAIFRHATEAFGRSVQLAESRMTVSI